MSESSTSTISHSKCMMLLLCQGWPTIDCLSIGHELLVDVRRGQLFCAACDDYVYSTDFDTAMAVRAAHHLRTETVWISCEA